MATSDDFWRDPLWLLAAAVGLAAVIAGLGWALSYVIPALGAAIGFVVAAAVHGTIAGVGSAWLGLASTAGAVLVTFSAGTFITVKVVNQFARNPFVPVAVLLGVLQTLVLDFIKEFWPGEVTARILTKAAAAGLFAIASVLWAQGGWRLRLSALVLYLVPPFLLLLDATVPYSELGFWQGVTKVDYLVWLALASLLCFVAAALLLGKLLELKESV